jgi:hypothetical protein
VDGKGTGADYTYWTYRIGRTERDGYSKWAQVKLDKVHLEADYGYARGDLSAAYPDELGPIHLYRHVVMTKDFILLVDEAGGEQPHTFTSLLHTDREINLITPTHAETEVGTARLGIYVPAPEHAVLTAEPAIVFGGRGPVGGGDEQRGYQLSIQTEEPVKSTTYVTLLVPQVETETPLQGVSLKKRNKSSLSVLIHWGARQQTVTLDLNWKEGRGTEPVIFKND